MAKKKTVGPAAHQLGFDFAFNDEVAAFETQVETVSRIQYDAGNDTPDLFEGINHVDKPIEASGIRAESATPGDTQSSSETAVQSARLEDSRPLGIQQPEGIDEPGSAGRGDLVGPAPGAAEQGDTSVSISGGIGGDGGPRSAPNASDRNRIAVKASDYVITNEDRLGQGGAKTKYRENIAALKLLQTLTAEKRPATKDEQATLVRYVGWGGIPQAFDHRNADWHNEFVELSSLLSKEEYEAARRSTQDAHYTAPKVIEAIYAGLSRIGFEGGKLAEPSVGIGNFIGLMPQSMRQKTKVTGIELDPTTAAIARHLYPSATIINKGYQDVTIPSGYFDAAVGNPPFGNQSLYDPNHRDLSEFSIHNYFIAKTLDKLRDGGVAPFVVSNFFMDAQNGAAREWIAERAHLLGAIRLPNTAFKENALTEVTTDIVFLQKAKDGEIPNKEWTKVGTIKDEETGKDIPINQYFVQNPHMVLGKMALTGTMYRQDMPTCLEVPGADLAESLAAAIQHLPQGVYSEQVQGIPQQEQETAAIELPDNIKVGAFFLVGDRIARRLPDVLDNPNYEWIQPKNAKAGERIKGMIQVRTALRDLMAAERSADTPDSDIATLRAKLNSVYDQFVKRSGYISALPNKQAFSDDPDYPLLHSLERDYDKGISAEIAKRDGIAQREPSAKKAAIFSKRVMTPYREITKANNAKDAMLVSLNERGRIDVPLMVQLTGSTEETIIKDLKGLIYQNPITNAWESADQYLTGNVKLKLAQSIDAAKNDPRFEGNVDALRLVQPADIDAVDIGIQLGSTWVPEKVVSDFVGHLLGNVHRNITYQPTLGKWMANIGASDQATMTIKWGTAEAPANKLIEAVLANKAIQVKREVGRDEHRNPIYEVNEEATAVANQKADEIKQAFIDWVWEDKDRRTELARIYNDTFNTNIAPKYDGSHLTLPGASLDIELRPHQKDAIWRGIQDGTALFDHRVGAGKTFVKIGVAMEARRMGLLNKPMLAVPNHLLLQWKDAFYALYPNANVLVAEKTDFTKENREKLFAKIATGDWDAVIVGHSSLKKIGMPKETLDAILNEQIVDLTDAIIKMKQDRGDRVTIKNMEKAKERMEAKLKRAADTGVKDKVVTFDELGVDGLLVDESHEFKNLFITTSLNRVSGLGDLAGSDKAFDLFVKIRYLQDKYDGRGVYFGTGTPISNTIAEMYTVQRYMQYDAMKARGIHHFDAWASTFGQVVTGWELDATGTNYKLNSRFAKFQNVPELIAMYRTFADVITQKDLEDQAAEQGKRFPVPKVKGGKPKNIIVERSELQAEYMGIQSPKLDDEGNPWTRADGSIIKDWNEGSIIYRMENLPKDPRIDNPLKITNDARKAGLDFRLINPSAPDHAGSKANELVSEAMRIYQEWNDKKGTQLIFCDLSTPKGAAPAAKAVEKVIATGDEAEQDGDEQEVVISMDELLAGSAKFSVYDDIKAKLIAHGVPEQEVAFIHDAKTDLQKAKLFDAVNAGRIRFLLGSTAKMGAGTNVQRKLVAEHHLDAPWRPSDLEQREGRILRQGNEFYEADPDGFEVEIIRYATKQTYDARMWQTIEYKAAGIEQFRKGDSLTRTIEDIAGEAANAAEMKAAATGNQLIFMQVQIQAELKKVEASYANYKRNQHTIESSLEWLGRGEERAEAAIKAVKRNIERRDSNTTDPWTFKSGGRTYNAESKNDLNMIVLSAMQGAIETRAKSKHDIPKAMRIGAYRGFDIEVHCVRDTLQFSLVGDKRHNPGNLTYDKDDKFSVSGFINRLDNYLDSFDEEIPDIEYQRKKDRIELEKLRQEVGKPFTDMAKLEMLRKDASEVMVELKKMQADDNYVSNWKPASLQPAPKKADEHTLDMFAVDQDTPKSETDPAYTEQIKKLREVTAAINHSFGYSREAEDISLSVEGEGEGGLPAPGLRPNPMPAQGTPEYGETVRRQIYERRESGEYYEMEKQAKQALGQDASFGVWASEDQVSGKVIAQSPYSFVLQTSANSAALFNKIDFRYLPDVEQEVLIGASDRQNPAGGRLIELLPSDRTKVAGPAPADRSAGSKNQDVREGIFSSTEKKTGDDFDAAAARASAFESMHPELAIKMHPELVPAYKILYSAKQRAEKFPNKDDQDKFLAMSRERITADLRAGKQLNAPSTQLSVDRSKEDAQPTPSPSTTRSRNDEDISRS